MHGSADMAGTSDGRSRRTFFRLEIVCQDQPLEMKLESTPDVSHVRNAGSSRPISKHEVRAHIFSGVSQLFFCGRVSWPQFRRQK